MAGVEAVVGGAFVSAIIKAVVNTGRSHFSEKHKEHKDTKKMLDNLNASIPEILSVIEFAEQKPMVKDASLALWLQQLKDVVYEAEDVMDNFEAKRIHESLANKGKVSEISSSISGIVKSFFLSDKDQKKLKYLVEKMENISRKVSNFIHVMDSRITNSVDGSSMSTISETSSHLPKTKKIFGREKDIDLILDMILEYPDRQSYLSNQKLHEKMWNFMGNISKFATNSIKRMNTALNRGENEESDTSDDNVSRHKDPFPFKEISTPPQGTQRSPHSEKGKLAQIKSLHYGSSSSVRNTSDIAQSSGKSVIRTGTPQTYLPERSFSDISFSVGNRLVGVLPIVGIGGVGKTTIAQVIYNSPRVKKQFQLQGWVYVVNSSDHVRIVHDILCSFEEGSSKSIAPITSLNNGHLRLKNAIDEKKFLIIFDDVREGGAALESTWRKLFEVLADGATGSIVVLTTESKSIATALGTLPSISVDVLQWNDFLALFKYHAFGHIKYNNKSESQYFPLTHYEETVLKPIGEKIAEKLGGLPLAAEVVGTLLSSNPDRIHWETILKGNWWEHENISEKILLSLGASFKNLDPDLKQCFLFCSLFPKNYVFDKDRLVQMWIAHGLIHPTEAENMKLETNELKIEDIGCFKFNKLVDRFFFQTTILENRYVMHDLIRELAIATSSEMLYVNNNYLINNKTITSSVRHLSIDPNIEDNVYVDDILWNNKNIQSLRTIMFFGFCKTRKDKSLQGILDELGRLRVLDLSYFRISSTILPDNFFGQLSHLRFLDLSFSGITMVPNSLCQLVHLKVLDFRGCKFSKMPDDMNRLINLRHLYASPSTISLIRGIGSLTNLQELEEFHIKNVKGFMISELKDLNSLQGQLTLKDLKEVPSKDMAITAALEDKRHLTSLIFSMGLDSLSELLIVSSNSEPTYIKHMEVLEGLKPHNNIRELKILSFQWNSFPSWIINIHEMKNLRSIKLESCMYVESLPPLGSLPKLEVLILEGLESIICIGKELYGSSDVIFPSLRELAFSGLDNWKQWLHIGERQLFPCLEKLKISGCSDLLEAPLHCLNSSVVQLHLSGCDKVTKNIGKFLANMTSLRELYLEASRYEKIDLCCDNLGELRDLTLGNIKILPHLEGQSCSLVNLKKLHFQGWRRVDPSDRPPLHSVLQEERMHCLPSLTSIEVRYCNGLPSILYSLGRLPSLRTLLIKYDSYGSEISTSDKESWFSGLTSLEEMELTGCFHWEHLPTSLSTLSSLKKFTLKDCPKIRSLPQERLPKSLKELHIIRCSDTLMQGCQPNSGKEWSKISHIPYIRVHDKK